MVGWTLVAMISRAVMVVAANSQLPAAVCVYRTSGSCCFVPSRRNRHGRRSKKLIDGSLSEESYSAVRDNATDRVLLPHGVGLVSLEV
jgi:hypothetical protein